MPIDLADCTTPEDVQAYLAYMEEMCRIQDGAIVFGRETGFYEIDLDRCSTPEKLLSWVLHIHKKTWVTDDILEKFILIAADHHGFNVRDLR
jgi:hypothetical protein